MKHKIASAKFHEGIFFPGLGDLGKSLPSTNKTLKDLQMNFEDGVLEVTTGGHTLLIPAPNIVAMSVQRDVSLAKGSAGSPATRAPTTVTVNTKSGSIKSN